MTGFLSKGQVRRLWDRTRILPRQSTVFEIGSYFGTSTTLLGAAAEEDVDVIAIDLHATGPYASTTNEEASKAVTPSR